VAKATSADFRGQPGSEVESAAAFEEMRGYVLDTEPHLFVFTTLRNYEDENGLNAFNLEKGWFRPATNAYVLPGSRLLFSQADGSQVSYRIAFYLTDGAWWFYFNDRPYACYNARTDTLEPSFTRKRSPRRGTLSESRPHQSVMPCLKRG
jgi:hypothetical protein